MSPEFIRDCFVIGRKKSKNLMKIVQKWNKFANYEVIEEKVLNSLILKKMEKNQKIMLTFS